MRMENPDTVGLLVFMCLVSFPGAFSLAPKRRAGGRGVSKKDSTAVGGRKRLLIYWKFASA